MGLNHETILYDAEALATQADSALPLVADTPKYNRAREMADEVMAELDAADHGWNEDDIARIQGTLLPRVYDCLNLIAIASPARAIPEQAEHLAKGTQGEGKR